MPLGSLVNAFRALVNASRALVNDGSGISECVSGISECLSGIRESCRRPSVPALDGTQRIPFTTETPRARRLAEKTRSHSGSQGLRGGRSSTRNPSAPPVMMVRPPRCRVSFNVGIGFSGGGTYRGNGRSGSTGLVVAKLLSR